MPDRFGVWKEKVQLHKKKLGQGMKRHGKERGQRGARGDF